ncbi:MAG: hypothetical protein Q9163_006222, partial [Psora crenata]
MMEPSAGYPESPMEQDDTIYSCKACGEILEEGKAFELAGYRWHVQCFRCHTCGTNLDSDANLLLLGDASLICNNCTYSCSVCASKIEDLAILTGDQAFCAKCFKCRNCKKKIENLKYARTSQGIFCMECHESLMQRRRKKSQKNPSTRNKHAQQPAANSSMLLHKSLPSLPPTAVDRGAMFSQENSSPLSEPYSETPTELIPAPQPRPPNSRSRSDQRTPDIPRAAQKRPTYPRSQSAKSEPRERPSSPGEERKENVAPSSHRSNSHRSNSDELSTHSDHSGNGEDFFIPMKLDPNVAPGPSPLARLEHDEMRSPPHNEGKPVSSDYFDSKAPPLRKQTIEQEPMQQKLPSRSSTNGSRHSSQPNSPHIAYQERGRQLSTDAALEYSRKKREHGPNSSMGSVAHDPVKSTPAAEVRSRRHAETQQKGKFMLQEVPKTKKSEKRNSKSDGQTTRADHNSPPTAKSNPASGPAYTQVKEQQVTVPPHESPESSRSDATLSGSPRDTHGSHSRTSTDSHSSPLGTQLKNPPERSDSLVKSSQHPPPRRSGEAGGGRKPARSMTPSLDGPDQPASIPPSMTLSPPTTSINRAAPRSPESPAANNLSETPTPPHPPVRAKDRLDLQQQGSSTESFVTPRAPPPPPVGGQKPRNELSGLRNGDLAVSPKLQRHPDKADIFLDEDSGHGQNDQPEQGGFLRRVSNSVRHGRSYSDRSGVRLSKENKWPKSPMMGSHSPSLVHGTSSPATSSPETKEQLEWFRSELRMERQRTLEKEQRVLELEQALDARNSIKKMNSELREKRSTMVVLDTQKEIVVRELEVLTEHIAASKKSGEPLDVSKMTNTVLREFAQSLQSLKDAFQPEIEELTQRKIDLLDELESINQQKDKSFQEFEQLSGKNAQLADLNNQLVHQVQELYKANAGPAIDMLQPPINGLGIYHAQPQKDRAHTSLDGRDPRPSITESNLTGSTVVPDHDAVPAAYESAPQVVNIRKAQPKKFNWKKGGQHVAKGVTKGLKGAFSSEGNRGQRDGQYATEGMPYGAMAQQEYPKTDGHAKGQSQDRGPGFGGFFGNPKTRPQQWKNSPNNSHPAVNIDGPPRTPTLDPFFPSVPSTNQWCVALFGSELEQRAEYERSNIPGIVMRCIQEVDAR